MASITVKSPNGKNSNATAELADDLFGIEPNVPVMHQVVTAQLAARRAGTQNTKTRSEVSGGGAKPWRQKGTGRARQGSIRSPQWRGGGVALGPKPRSYAQRTPKKMIRLALRSALSDRAAEDKVVVVDDWGFDAPSTKAALAALGAIGVDRKVLVVLRSDDEVAWRSFRNLPHVQLIEVGELNAYDVLCNDWIVFTTDTLPTAETSTPSAAGRAAASQADAEDAAAEDPTGADAEVAASDERNEGLDTQLDADPTDGVAAASDDDDTEDDQ